MTTKPRKRSPKPPDRRQGEQKTNAMPVSQSPQSATECQNLSEFFNAIRSIADFQARMSVFARLAD